MTGEPRRRRRLVPFLAVAAFLVIVPRPATAQSTVDLYLSMVDQYASGDAAGAINRSMSNVPHVPSEITSHRRALSGRQLRSAVMLHTELAAAYLINGRRGPAVSQIGEARRLIGALTDNVEQRTASKTFVVRWHAFVMSLYASEGLFDQAFQLGREGFGFYGRTPELTVAQGAVSEVRASLIDARRLHNVGGDRMYAARRFYEIAAREYADALSADPHNASAHLHRGWIHHRLGDGRAEEDLEAALRDASEDATRYLAHLFLGAEAEHREKLEEARAHYEAANRLGPAQSSTVALSRVESALGHSDRARAVTLEFAQDANHPEDPWWNYLLGGFEPGAIGWLRVAARQP